MAEATSLFGRLWPFSRSRSQTDAERLVDTVSQVSRQPGFFGAGRVADTLDGRLEMVILHACLAFIRLRREAEYAPLAQAFADALFRHFDAGLREAAVGDTAVPKRMHKIAGDFFGRLDAYAGALSAADSAALKAAIARNVFGAADAPFALALAAYAAETFAKQGSNPIEDLFRLDGWMPAPA